MYNIYEDLDAPGEPLLQYYFDSEYNITKIEPLSDFFVDSSNQIITLPTISYNNLTVGKSLLQISDIARHPHFKNILLVHNRKHHSKRYKVKGEANIDPTNTGLLREQHSWYKRAYNASSENLANLFNPNYKFKTWNDAL